MSTLSDRLAWALKESGLSQRALSRAAGLQSERHVGFLVSGDRSNPELKTIQALAVALNVSLGWLANGDEPEPDAASIKATGDAFIAKEKAEAEARKSTDSDGAKPTSVEQ
jgi:transcriptional regulator with XRE-family HTH domain